jgi:hypothetical protein
MGFSFAHGTQKRRIVAALWRLSYLNLVTTPGKYPLPNIQDLSNVPHGCTIFPKIDLVKGYHQIPVATEDIPETAIITLFSLFEYLFTLFGLYNAAQTFQRIVARQHQQENPGFTQLPPRGMNPGPL